MCYFFPIDSYVSIDSYVCFDHLQLFCFLQGLIELFYLHLLLMRSLWFLGTDFLVLLLLVLNGLDVMERTLMVVLYLQNIHYQILYSHFQYWIVIYVANF